MVWCGVVCVCVCVCVTMGIWRSEDNLGVGSLHPPWGPKDQTQMFRLRNKAGSHQSLLFLCRKTRGK
ncbi:rCG63508 [Rattus norvegicus]|uniref:RCG63508 n=1 Tax=Rattus norvegicus TaxID=10116 RepID=A6HCM3_RAT|nr:rCG63508 [Rattus norvegicus]